MSIYVKYGLKKTEGITTDIQVNIGDFDLNHPLHEKIENFGKGCVILKPSLENIQTICNDIDLLEFLYENNWELIHSTKIEILSAPYTNYILRHNSR